MFVGTIQTLEICEQRSRGSDYRQDAVIQKMPIDIVNLLTLYRE
jgi:hypothetical protein